MAALDANRGPPDQNADPMSRVSVRGSSGAQVETSDQIILGILKITQVPSMKTKIDIPIKEESEILRRQ